MLEGILGVLLAMVSLGLLYLWDVWRHRKAKHTH